MPHVFLQQFSVVLTDEKALMLYVYKVALKQGAVSQKALEISQGSTVTR